MASQTIILLDQEQSISMDQWQLTSKEIAGAPEGAAVSMRRLRGGLSDGVDAVDVNNGAFRFTILPTRGMGIWKAWHDSLELGWQSPARGPVHPKFVPLHEPTGLGWLDGFDELVCRCGLASNGAPDFDESGKLTHPLHGRIANRPAHHVEVRIEGDEISVIGVVEEARFHFTKLRLTSTIKTRFGEPGFRIHDEIENISASDAEAQLLYHINFGAPLLSAGAELVLPFQKLVPRNDWSAEGVGHWSTYSAPTAGLPERVFFFELIGDQRGDTQVLLKNANEKKGVNLRFNTKQLPCFTQWKNETALKDGYVTGLEPGTNFPNPRSFEGQHQRFAKLQPGATYAADIALSVLDEKGIATCDAEIAKLQANFAPEVGTSPSVDWCAP